MLCSLVLFFLAFEKPILPPDMTLVGVFESPKATLSLPGFVDFDAEGRVYLMDQKEGHVLVWNKDRKYAMKFGEKGVEEGTMKNPIIVTAGPDTIWVWNRNQMLYEFDMTGKVLREFRLKGAFPKSVAVLQKNLLLLGTEAIIDEQFHMKTLLLDLRKPEPTLNELMGFETTTLLDRKKEGTKEEMSVKAFAGDMDIQKRGDHWVIGYGEDPYLFSVDKEGNIINQEEVILKREMASAEDQAYVKKMEYPVWSGHRIQLEDDMTKLNFKDKKAAYTQFTIKGNKGFFLLTASGGFMTDLYPHSPRGSYQIFDFDKKQVTATGSFELPGDSKVFLRNGRIFVALHKADKSFTFAEVNFNGF